MEVLLPLTEITPYLNNPRDIRPAIEAVKESIRRYGFNVPMVLDRKHVIITGHARFQALTELGQTEAWCIISDMPVELANEYRLVDNRSSEIAMWDRDRLVAELRAIEGDMGIFFESNELASLMGELNQIDTRTVTQATIQKTQTELDGHFEGLAQQMDARVAKVQCKHCGKHFGFDIDIKGYGFNPHEATRPAGM